jgi:hypothetical protein
LFHHCSRSSAPVRNFPTLGETSTLFRYGQYHLPTRWLPV